MMRITLCTECSPAQKDLAEHLRAALQDLKINATILTAGCMSGCARASTVSFRSNGKTAYLFGDISASDLGDLTTFARHYENSPNGNLSDARVLGALRFKAIARIPG